ncbi:MAG: hypothetical protein ACI9SY_000141 [Candidatus Paceibacteria bacterium]|jgi:hypothetical protein
MNSTEDLTMNYDHMHIVAMRAVRRFHTRQRAHLVRPVYERILRKELSTMPPLRKRAV